MAVNERQMIDNLADDLERAGAAPEIVEQIRQATTIDEARAILTDAGLGNLLPPEAVQGGDTELVPTTPQLEAQTTFPRTGQGPPLSGQTITITNPDGSQITVNPQGGFFDENGQFIFDIPDEALAGLPAAPPYLGAPPGEIISLPDNLGDVFNIVPSLPPEIAGLPLELRSSLERAFITDASDYYRSGDEWRIFVALSPERRAQVKQQLVDAGLLNEASLEGGRRATVWDAEAADAMRVVLTMANGNSMQWWTALRSVADGAEERRKAARESLTQPFVAQPYVAPDWATLAQAARETASRELGRDLKDWEVAMLGDELSAYSRQQYGAEVAAARAYHDAGNRAIVEETDQSAGTVQGVSAADRFAERFRELYGPEMNRLDRIAQAKTNFGTMMASITGTTRMVEG